MPDSPVTDRETLVQRVVHSPPEAVFAALSDPERLTHWWGTGEETAVTKRFEFVPGGAWVFTVIGADGDRRDVDLEWQEIVPDSRLSFRRASGDDPSEDVITRITIEPVTNGSEVTHQTIFPSRQQRRTHGDDALVRAERSLERLAVHLSDHTGEPS